MTNSDKKILILAVGLVLVSIPECRKLCRDVAESLIAMSLRS
jgi:hypothetical protein